MSKNQYSLLEKPLVIRLPELAQSLQIINDSYDLISNGKEYQFIPIYGQLRSLLTEKSKNQTPLLFELADKFNEKLELFYIPFEDLPEDLPKVDYHYMSPEISCEKKEKNQIIIEFKDFLMCDIILLNSRKYKINFVINALANKFGGSHYASKIEQEIAELFYFTIFNKNILNQIIFQIGKVTLELGTKVVQKLNQLCFYYSIYLPNQELSEQQYLIDYYSKSYGLRYSLLLDKARQLAIRVIDLNKNVWIFKSDKPVSFETILNLQVIIGFSKNLKSVFRLIVNNEALIDQQIELFVPISNEMHLFDCYYNRSQENEDDGLSFLLYETIIRVILPDENETKSILNYMQSKNIINGKGIFFSKGNYGLTTQGERDMKMHGIVKHVSVEDISSDS